MWQALTRVSIASCMQPSMQRHYSPWRMQSQAFLPRPFRKMSEILQLGPSNGLMIITCTQAKFTLIAFWKHIAIAPPIGATSSSPTVRVYMHTLTSSNVYYKAAIKVLLPAGLCQVGFAFVAAAAHSQVSDQCPRLCHIPLF